MKEWKKSAEKKSTDELRKLQDDPTFLQRAKLWNLIEHDLARPGEIYQLVVSL